MPVYLISRKDGYITRLKITVLILSLAALACSLSNRAALAAMPTPTATQAATLAASMIPRAGSTQMPTVKAITTSATRVSSTPTLAAWCRVATGIVAGRLNLRSGPGVAYPVLAVLWEGDTLQITKQVGGWLAVLTSTDQNGYIYSTYCKKGK